LSAVASFFASYIYYDALQNLLFRFTHSNFVAEVILYFSYFVFLVVGAACWRARISIIHAVGALFVGLGLGIVVRIALILVSIINPYNIY